MRAIPARAGNTWIMVDHATGVAGLDCSLVINWRSKSVLSCLLSFLEIYPRSDEGLLTGGRCGII